MNVLTISWPGETARKLAWKIVNVPLVFQVGILLVHCPCPCSVFAVYQVGTPPLAPSVKNLNLGDLRDPVAMRLLRLGCFDWESPNVSGPFRDMQYSAVLASRLFARVINLEKEVKSTSPEFVKLKEVGVSL